MAEMTETFVWQACTNCCVYAWENTEDPATLQRCSRCKVVLYCGLSCQKEHWVKVHKAYCKVLSGDKKAPQSLHR